MEVRVRLLGIPEVIALLVLCAANVRASSPCSWKATTSSPWYGRADTTSQKIDLTGLWNKTAAAAASSATKRKTISISKLTFYYNRTSECLDGIKLSYGDGKSQLIGNNATGLLKQGMTLVNETSVAGGTLVMNTKCLAWAQFSTTNGSAFSVGLTTTSPATSNPSKYRVINAMPVMKAEQLVSIRGYVSTSSTSSRGRLQQLQLVWGACVAAVATPVRTPAMEAPKPGVPLPAVDPASGSFSGSGTPDTLPLDLYNMPTAYAHEEKYNKEGLPHMIRWLLEVTEDGTKHPKHDITGMQFMMNISVGMNKPLDFKNLDTPWAANVTDILNIIHLPVLPPGYGYSNSYTQTQQQLVDLAKFIDYISGAATFQPTLGMLITGFGESLKTALPSELRLPGGGSLTLPGAAIAAVPDEAPTKEQLAAQQVQQYQSITVPNEQYQSGIVPNKQYQGGTVPTGLSKPIPPPKLAPLAKFLTGVFGPVGFAMSKLQELKQLPQGKALDLKGLISPLTAVCKLQLALPAPPGGWDAPPRYISNPGNTCMSNLRQLQDLQEALDQTDKVCDTRILHEILRGAPIEQYTKPAEGTGMYSGTSKLDAALQCLFFKVTGPWAYMVKKFANSLS